MAECRARAADTGAERRLAGRGRLLVVLLWVSLLSLMLALLVPRWLVHAA
jgi:hypothetical protein